MKHVEVFTWLMPPPARTPTDKPKKSRWKMTAVQAAQHGAFEPAPAPEDAQPSGDREEVSANLTIAWQKRPPA